MAATTQPLTEKLTFGWHDHFATDVHKVRDARLMLAQNATLRRMGRGSFTDLAKAIVVDPAMLVWLDGRLSTAKAPNENLAREFMSSSPSGTATATPSRTSARAPGRSHGWTVDGTAARFVPRRHDDGSKTVLGRTGDLDTRRLRRRGAVRAGVGRLPSRPGGGSGSSPPPRRARRS